MEYELLANKNAQLGAEFDFFLLENPDFADQLPKGAKVVLLPEWDKELAEYNIRISEAHKDDGLPIVYIRIENLAPPKSRLINPTMEVVSEGDPVKTEADWKPFHDYWKREVMSEKV